MKIKIKSANNSLSNINTDTRETIYYYIDKWFAQIKKLNSQINLSNDDLLKSHFRDVKNTICKHSVDYLNQCIKITQNSLDQKEWRSNIAKFLSEIENESELVIEKYKDFKPENALSNLMILEIKSIYKNLAEKINNYFTDKNIDEQTRFKVWQLNSWRFEYEQFLNKLKTHEQVIKEYQGKILKCYSLSIASFFDIELKKKHQETIDKLNFNSKHLIKLFKTLVRKTSDHTLEDQILNQPNNLNILSTEELLRYIAKLQQTIVEKDQKLASLNNVNQKLIIKNYELLQIEMPGLKAQVHDIKIKYDILRNQHHVSNNFSVGEAAKGGGNQESQALSGDRYEILEEV